MTAAFFVVACALAGLALASVLPAALRVPVVRRADAGTAHLDALRAQLARLDAERAAGLIAPADHARARSELEVRALEVDTAVVARATSAGPRTAWGLALAIPLFSVALYAGLGRPGAVDDEATGRAPIATSDVEAMLAQLEAGLRTPQPGVAPDPAAWQMLARTYAGLNRFDDAARALAKAIDLRPDDASLLADRADLLMMTPSAASQVEADRLVRRALALDPAHVKTLALAGGMAFSRGEHAAAIAYWTRARALAPADGEFAEGLEGSLAAARQALLAQNSATTAPSQPMAAGTPHTQNFAGSGTAAAGGPRLQGELRIAPALAQRLAPGDAVFVLARSVEGSRMPVAIRRYTAGELPLRFVLDDAASLLPERRLSTVGPVIVAVRVSRTGDARAQPGDLWTESQPVRAGAPALTLTIDRIQE